LIQFEQGKEYKIVGPRMTGGPCGRGVGAAIRKKGQDLADIFSRVIEEMIRDGSLKN
jgi:hypothetical protein